MTKTERLLETFYFLLLGGSYLPEELAEKYEVDSATLLNEVKEIEEFFSSFFGFDVELISETDDYISLDYELERGLSKRDIFVIAKILLGSRTFTKTGVEKLIDKLDLYYKLASKETDPFGNQVKDSMLDEYRGYLASFPYQLEQINDPSKVELPEVMKLEAQELMVNKVWKLEQAGQESRRVNFTYLEADTRKEYHLIPMGVTFANGYFYLVGRPEKYEPISTFRLAKIVEYELEPPADTELGYAERYLVGELKLRAPHLQPGQKHELTVLYTGDEITELLNELPPAKKVKSSAEGYRIQVTINGWQATKQILLSYGTDLELEEPVELRQDLAATIGQMQEMYRAEG